jgi:hypothetical protein
VSEARERLVAMVAVLRGGAAVNQTPWELGEAIVAAMEAEPDKPVQCPCCTKLVTLCIKHYQLHEPGKPCVTCRSEE